MDPMALKMYQLLIFVLGLIYIIVSIPILKKESINPSLADSETLTVNSHLIFGPMLTFLGIALILTSILLSFLFI